MTKIVDIINIKKYFQNQCVLQNVNLQIQSGQCVAFIGRNGSGKSVLLQIIVGFIKPDEGKILVCEKQVGKTTEFAQNTGFLINAPGLVPNYNIMQNMHFFAQLNGVKDDAYLKSLIEKVGLDPNSKKPVKTYSTGMLQRLGIACAIMGNPKLVILDEPYTAVDKSGRSIIQNIIKELKQSGSAVIVTGHSVSDFETVADTTYLFDDGNVTTYAQ